MNQKVDVIIVAAGKGSRFGGELPKQFCLLGDRPVLMHTVVRMGRALPQARIAIVLHPEYIEFWERLCRQYGFDSPLVVAGGATRWESVHNAVDVLQPADDAVVLVHDGARPVVQKTVVDRIMQAMESVDAVVPGIGVSDSLRQLYGDGTSHAIDRSRLVAVQTPQAFRGSKLKQAYRLPYVPEFTDDASVYEAAGFGSPAIVEGSPLNIKITHPLDIDVAELFMSAK